MLYLLVHLILSQRDPSMPKGGASTPWTEYIKFLPRPIPVPTMWLEYERILLQGTSLEAGCILSLVICGLRVQLGPRLRMSLTRTNV